MEKILTTIVLIASLAGCSSASNLTFYQQLDGKAGLQRLVDSFINQIGNDEQIIHYFEHANISHFREGFINHLCVLTDGPCEYTRDSMVDIHTGMHITEADFNHVVDLLINAMNEQNISHTVQNKILAKMAPLRAEIIKI
ncbi:group 1 truncated hemoglobin [Pseudoalteromonas sp. SR44-5]|uniref:group I truncated hemoglobin n=1 Tax=Pseudoalteromonas TaxID=53246 RepID=UPI001603494D|nr:MULTISPECIES: group 1 truncated hemoglobin [unclassified Pseudoalteromonas]MBB1331821.1 group 1 truncated hemoglobin [Pseudoalteromonas sp. SR41-6]MBB1341687.1 group 1 truncated hemoglobin [Pseudoalteromonas sp. SR45-6]MBB1366942.1 group 1 truncated hemoglobin [Pseudoalteromonas sp. SR44-5]MBB1417859.1 group 1 truncated hemoglobin [Pseudoalteromonas sp. SG44-1]MBB1423434.1 group 1 truncated hemoglobin [Pseudoalteromonas sp. SG43-7]